MSFRAYEYEPNTGALKQILGAPPGDPIEKVAFLSEQSPFQVQWTGPNMSGGAKAMQTKITLGPKTYTQGWFAICRQQVNGVQFTAKAGGAPTQVNFSGVAGWPPDQHGLDGRVIVQRPGSLPPRLDVQALAIGFTAGVAVATIAFVSWFQWLR